MRFGLRQLSSVLLAGVASVPVYAEEPATMEEIRVVGSAPRSGLSLDADRLPIQVQSLQLQEEEITHTGALGNRHRDRSGVFPFLSTNPWKSGPFDYS